MITSSSNPNEVFAELRAILEPYSKSIGGDCRQPDWLQSGYPPHLA